MCAGAAGAEYFFLKIETNKFTHTYNIGKTIFMAVHYIGEFEELVLLTVAALREEAYGVSIQQDIETRCHRSISIGALHSTITRLEEKGYLKSGWVVPQQNAVAAANATLK